MVFWILFILVLLTVKVRDCYIFISSITNLCVGYNAPIDFNPCILPHLLATTQLHVKNILAVFTRQYILTPHVDSSTSEARQAHDTALLTEVLPQLDIDLMAVTPMERHFGQFCYINHSAAVLPQSTGSLTPATP